MFVERRAFPEAVGCPGEVCRGLTGKAAWTSPPGYRLIRLLESKRVTRSDLCFRKITLAATVKPDLKGQGAAGRQL